MAKTILTAALQAARVEPLPIVMSTLNSTWVPDESSQILFSERCWFQGVVISSIAYGINVSLYFLSFYLLIRDKGRIEFRRRLPLLVYISVTFLLSTLFMIGLAAFSQMSFIDDRNFPGGPNAFEIYEFAIPIDFVDSATFVLSNWLSDALVVWRFKVIYYKCRAPVWAVMLFPSLMLGGSVAMGVIFLIQASTTGPWVLSSVDYMLPYLSISLALNIILTIAIVIRLLSFRYRAVTVLGPAHGTRYTSFAAIIIESAALYSTVSITFLVSFGVGNAISQALLQALSQFQTMATLLIVFRVAQGKAWTDDTAEYVASIREIDLPKMRFASPTRASGTLAGPVEGVTITREEFRV